MKRALHEYADLAAVTDLDAQRYRATLTRLEHQIAICDDFDHKRRLIRLAAQLKRARASMLAFASIVRDPA